MHALRSARGPMHTLKTLPLLTLTSAMHGNPQEWSQELPPYFRQPTIANTLVLFLTRFPHLVVICNLSKYITSLIKATLGSPEARYRDGTTVVEAKPKLEIYWGTNLTPSYFFNYLFSNSLAYN